MYDFLCAGCGRTTEAFAPIVDGPPEPFACVCGDRYRRVYTIPAVSHSLGGAIEPHFNHSVGEVVHNMGEMKSALARKSETMSERLGIPIDLKPLDSREVGAHPSDFGVGDADKVRRTKELRRAAE